ncbi:MAG: restriction endonuclease subunit S [Bacteroidetes bacterium]|nr:restriction endonuclease subunit S [Bacteroidota bacterium]MBU2584511.1 restriction endonuclease subunit S [Bacteroidota bacterium]
MENGKNLLKYFDIKNKNIVHNTIMFYLRTQTSFMNELATSTTIAYLNKDNCNSLPINLPPLEEQIEIVRRVEQLFKFAD